MIQTQLVPISFIGGIDTKTDEKSVSAAKLTKLENGVFTKGHKITKRNGYDKIAAISSNPQGLLSYKNELLKFDNFKVYSYSDGTGELLDKGSVYSTETDVVNVSSSDVDVSLSDMELTTDHEVYAYNNSALTIGFTEATARMFVSVIDRNTRAVVVNRLDIGAYFKPRLVKTINGVYLVALGAGGTKIYAAKFDSTTANPFSTMAAIKDNLGADIAASDFDVCVINDTVLVTYKNVNNIGFIYLKANGAGGSVIDGYPNPVTYAATGTLRTITIMPDEANSCFYVFYDNAAFDARAKKLSLDFSLIVSDALIKSLGVSPEVRRLIPVKDGSSIAIIAEVGSILSPSFAYTELHYTVTTEALGTGSALTYFHTNAAMMTAMTAYRSHNYAIIGVNQLEQATYYLAEFSVSGTTLISTLVSKALPDSAGISWSINKKASQSCYGYKTLVKLDADTLYFAGLKANYSVSVTDVSLVKRFVYGEILVKFNMDPNNSFYGKRVGENLFISGGMVSEYDGVSCYEAGFNQYPIVSLVDAAGLMGAGTYLYYIMYEWTDNNGQLHRSAPAVETITIGANRQVSVTSYTLTLTKKSSLFGRDDVKVAIYRTVANGVTAYKVGEVKNNIGTYQVTFTDNSVDSDIVTKAQYIPSVLTNGPIQSAKVVEVYRDRVMLAGLENPLEVRFSKSYQPGYQVGFPSEFTFRVNPLGGDIKGLKFMDDKLLIFKENLIFVLAGDGPNDLGQGQQYTGAELLSTDVGCPYPNSIVLTPMGVMFKSHKGIYLINRNLQVSYIGAEVEAYNGLTIQSGDLIQDKNQVRFLHRDGVCLMYDYYFSQWSTFTNHSGVDADIWSGVYTYLRNDGSIYKENASKYKDDEQAYSLKIYTAWIKLNGLQGFQRVRRASVIGNLEASHVLKIGIGYDYSANFDSLFYFDPGAILGQNPYGTGIYGELTPYGGSTDNLYQFRMHIPKQKCESIRFSFEDLAGNDATIGYSLNELMLDVGIKKGGYKLPSTKSL